MRIIGALVAVALLSGCAAADTQPEAAEVESPNVEVCELTELLAADLVDMVIDVTSDAERLQDIRGEFDSLALSADGDVKTRLLTLVGTIPDIPATWLVEPADDYFQALEDVGRACLAETGVPFEVHTWK